MDRRIAILLVAVAGCDDGGSDVVPAVEVTHFPPFTVRGRLTEPKDIAYALDSAGGPLTEDLFRDTMERATVVWEETGIVDFAEAAPGRRPDFTFRFGASVSDEDPDAPFGRDTSVAMTTAMGPGCEVIFDGSLGWREAGASEGPSLYQAAVHELGHVLGLGHSSDVESVLHPQRENGRTVLGASDLAGLWSLYGGGEDGAGDLAIEGGTALRRVAPPGDTEWTLFDTDGDGDDEALVWSVSDTGFGELMIYFFVRGPVVERSVGPILGVAGPRTSVGAEVSESGQRQLVVQLPGGGAMIRAFDDRGVPGTVLPAMGVTVPEPRWLGDLDGDGLEEPVRRLKE